MKKYAIISVFNKDEILEFARGLVERGYSLLSTGGSGRALLEAGIEFTPIDEFTGQVEIMDGRVKTLHPKIHAGLLARRDNELDMEQLQAAGSAPIDFVVVNLYPFLQQVEKVVAEGTQPDSLIEFIDIGGPTMLRAAAKNNKFVLPVCDPADYSRLLTALDAGAIDESLRRELAGKVFRTMAAYDGEIARYFSLDERVLDDAGKEQTLAEFESVSLVQSQSLRYGENPHQHAALYSLATAASTPCWKQLQGKELSYNNILDTDAAIRLAAELEPKAGYAAAVIKHTNPCGAALGTTPQEAFERARACDPLSAFGGIVALNATIDEALATSIVEGFVEVVVAASFSPEAKAVFAKKKNIRLIELDFSALGAQQGRGNVELRKTFAGYLLQTQDSAIESVHDAEVATALAPTEAQLIDLDLAWRVCKHVKSNAIVVVKDGQAIGVGAGQMSRVDSAQLALRRAATHSHDTQGAVAASDAFLPFPDTLEILSDAGVGALVQPGGSIKDDTVVTVANERKVAMLFTGTRHFRH